MGQRKEEIRGRRETGENWKKTKPVWEKGPLVIVAYLSPRTGVCSFGVFMSLVEHKGSNAELVPGLWSPKLIQLGGGGSGQGEEDYTKL